MECAGFSLAAVRAGFFLAVVRAGFSLAAVCAGFSVAAVRGLDGCHTRGLVAPQNVGS